MSDKVMTVAELESLRDRNDVELDYLSREYDRIMFQLPEKQRRLVRGLLKFDSYADAAEYAGYSRRYPVRQAIERNPEILVAHDMQMQMESLVKGIPLSHKRSMLLKLANDTRDPLQESFNPNAAINSIKLLAQLDGDLDSAGAGPGGPGSINIQINTGVGREPGNTHAANVVINPPAGKDEELPW